MPVFVYDTNKVPKNYKILQRHKHSSLLKYIRTQQEYVWEVFPPIISPIK